MIVENNRENFNLIKKNVAKINNSENIRIINSDAISFLTKIGKKIDLAFLDPPYGSESLNNTLFEAAPAMALEGIIITETSSSENILKNFQEFALQKRYKYGNITLNLYASEVMTF